MTRFRWTGVQFVLWPMTRKIYWWPLFRFRRWRGGIGKIYSWSIDLGPLEIRRWR